jgi:UPF0716 protein FxsA
MALLLVLIFVVAPLAELAVIVQVAGSIGVLNTIGLLVVVSMVGAWLARREGLVTLQRVQATLGRGEIPGRELADGALILLAGALMIAPGFISDAVALLLLLPPTRAIVRPALVRAFTARSRITVVGAGSRTARNPGTADVWDVESWEEPAGPPAPGELRGPT